MKTVKMMSAVAAVVGSMSAVSSAAIIPSWRINPITPAAIAAEPSLANAMSVSLLVTLTDGSLFNVAGLDLGSVLLGVPFYNSPAGSSSGPPNTQFIPFFPAIEFDSYVSTSIRTDAAVPGRLNGTGPAQFGPDDFNVAWGATPNTGPLGGVNLEIARITMFGDASRPSLNSIPLTNGRVRDSINPNADVALPPMPSVFIPEPATAGLLAASVLLRRRRR